MQSNKQYITIPVFIIIQATQSSLQTILMSLTMVVFVVSSSQHISQTFDIILELLFFDVLITTSKETRYSGLLQKHCLDPIYFDGCVVFQ